MKKQYWLFKTEPDAFSIDDLQEVAQEMWDGIRNYQARNFLRDQISVGDEVFIYHSSCKQVGIAGTAKVVTDAYPDPTQFDPESKYYDPKSDKDKPRWFLVDVSFQKKFPQILSLAELKQNPALKDMQLLKRGNRLSIMPITQQEWQSICNMIG